MVFSGTLCPCQPLLIFCLFVLICNCEFLSELFLMAWRLEVLLVRLGGTGKWHCRTEHFGLLTTGEKKGKMLPKW